jgi:type IX secretion system PorP/SprF family membrane protein
LVIMLVFPLIISAQHENHFSQFYNTPQYINPAFAGDAAYVKVATATRIMNPVAGFRTTNSVLQFDFKLLNYNSGLGVMIYNHSDLLSQSKIQINYSYTVQLSEKGWFRAGLGISENQRRTNVNTFKYPDQFDNNGYTGNTTNEYYLNEKSLFPSLTAGMVLYNKFVWLSFAGDNLNRPKENFAGQDIKNPMIFNVASGFVIPINAYRNTKRRFGKYGGIKPFSSIGPVVYFTKQEKYTEFSGGIAFHFQPIYGGLNVRYQHDFNIEKNTNTYEALVFILGYRQEEFTVAYSYDAALGNKTINKSGAHEISLVFYFSNYKEDYKRHAFVPVISQLMY